MEDGHAGHPADKLEVGQVVLVAHPRVGVDLEQIKQVSR